MRGELYTFVFLAPLFFMAMCLFVKEEGIIFKAQWSGGAAEAPPVVYLRIVHVLLHSVQKSFLYFNFLSTLWPNDTARNLRTFCKTILNNSFGVGGDDFVIIC